jgi:hypothetical protein
MFCHKYILDQMLALKAKRIRRKASWLFLVPGKKQTHHKVGLCSNNIA